MEYILSISERARADAAHDRARVMLGEEHFAEAWDAGFRLTRDAAVASALALASIAHGP